MATRDYYAVLGLRRSATDAEIKQAYRSLAKRYHPDVTGDDEQATERFKQITEAYETLSDPARRRRYDLFGGPATANDGGPLSDLKTAYDSVVDFFQKKETPPTPGHDVEVDVNVTLRDVYIGVRRPVSVVLDRPCATCGGTGRDAGARCATCGGQGQKLATDELIVQVPPGADDGTRLRLKKRGPAGGKNGPPGDLYVVVHVARDPRFDRDGETLFLDARVPVSVALLGGECKVALPEGDVTIKVPAGTQGGTVFRVREKGFPRVGSDARRGDALVTLQIDVPRALDDDARKRVADLRDRVRGF